MLVERRAVADVSCLFVVPDGGGGGMFTYYWANCLLVGEGLVLRCLHRDVGAASYRWWCSDVSWLPDVDIIQQTCQCDLTRTTLTRNLYIKWTSMFMVKHRQRDLCYNILKL